VECVAWGGNLTRLQAHAATLFEELAAYLRPPEMQELLVKGDRYRTGLDSGSIADRCITPFVKGADGLRVEAAKTASGILLDCQVQTVQIVRALIAHPSHSQTALQLTIHNRNRLYEVAHLIA
jgi:hypothetical protein